jgi:hypothetical protein
MTVIASTSGCLHSEFVCLLFLQTHRETDRFFKVSGVQFPESNRTQFHYQSVVFSPQVKSKVVNILGKTEVLRVNLNIDDAPTTYRILDRTHTHHTLKPNLVSIFRCSSPPIKQVYVRTREGVKTSTSS